MRIESERRTLPVLRALVVKNWTVKRRHPFATWSEVLNPLLCILLFVALKRFEPDVMVPAGWATSDVNESASAYGSTWNLYATTDVESALNEGLSSAGIVVPKDSKSGSGGSNSSDGTFSATSLLEILSNSLQIPRFYFTETTMPGLLLSLSLQALMEGNNLAELGEEGLMDCALKFLLFGYTGAERTTYHVPNACKGKVVPYKIAITPDTPYTREYFAAALETWYPRIALAPPVKGISLLTIPSFADSHVFFDNETALEAYVTSEEYGTEVQYPKIYGAIAFEEFPQDISTFGDLEGYSIAYSLRFNSTGSVSAVPKTKKPRPNTISKFVPAENTMKYATRGFMTLQTVVARFLNCMPIWDAQSETTNGTCQVDQAVMAANAENDRRLLEQLEKDMIIGTAFTLLNTVKDLITSIASVTLPNVSVDTIPPLSVERLLVPLRMAPQSYHGAGVYGTPTQAFRYAPFFDKIAVVFPIGFVLSYLYLVSRVIVSFLMEKETRSRELMRILGAKDTELFAGWVLAYLPILLLGAMLQTFGAHGLLFPNSDTKLLFLFFFTFATSSFSYGFMISSLFSRARAGSLAGMGLFFIMFFLSYSFSDDTSEASRTCAALLPPISLSQGIGVIAKLESYGVGVNHDNASEDVNNFRLANAIGMQILDTVLYILLGKYFEKVVPQEFGVAEKWYVFLTKGYWCPQSSKLVSTEEIGGMSATYNDNVEAVRQELETQENSGRAVVITGLRKEFLVPGGKKIAVHGLDLKLYEGQITCLLGHNGAGKTTVMSMLTGMTRPSSGNAWVRGHSVVTDMRKIRRSLGYCPQHSVLYPDLTVKEHLTFYGRLKGFTNASELAAEVIKKINEVGLADKTNVRSHALSGGMQRKLSLAIAFLGDSTVVFLDEPTAGMDPYSRRSTWELIQRNRAGRVVILTTHFLDEADILGDRIAIMAEGKLQCVGSSLFLKKRFGVGYRLSFVRQSNNGMPSLSIASLIQHRVPQAIIASDVGTELTFQLPFEASAGFPELFRELESHQAELGILSFAISVTTLEEIFLKVAESGSAEVLAKESREDRADTNMDGKLSITVQPREAAIVVGSARINMKNAIEGDDTESQRSQVASTRAVRTFLSQIKALLRKRMQCGKRDFNMLFFSTILPIAAIFIGLSALKFSVVLLNDPKLELSSTVQYSLAQRTPVPFGCPDPNGDGNTAWCSELVEPPYFLEGAAYELEIDATVYSASTTPTVFGVSYDSPAIEPNDSTGYNLRLAELVFEKGYGYTSDANMTALPTQASVEGQFGGYLLYASESTNTMSYNVLANGSSTHAAPTYKHMIDNAIHRFVLSKASGGSSPNVTIRVSSHPLPLSFKTRTIFSSYLSFPAVIFIVIAFTFIPASMMPYIVKEKHLEQNAKYQQLLSGMSFFAYWLSNFIFDVALYLVPMAATLLLLRSYGVTKSLSSGDTCDSCTQDVPAAMVTLFVLFGTAIAPWTYLLSHVMEKPSECLLYTVVINFFLGLLLLLLSFTMNSLDSTRPANEVLVYIWRCSPLFAFGNGFLNVLLADLLALFGLTSTPRSAFDADVAGTDIWYLLIECPLFLLLTVGIDVVQAGTVRWRIAQFMDKINNARRMYTRVPCTNTKLHIQQKCVGGKVIESENIDSDVAAEARRVQESYNSLAASSEVVQIFELEKVYPNGKRAVKCLSFGLQQGECYGFLGVNGAGKTTTMKVLTGDLLPTSGTATINGFDICKERSKARDSIGYCPQFDALIDLLTVREHLELFGRFKGFDTTDRLKKEVDRLLNKLQIQSFANKLAGSLSGGNKRKLSLAIAMIGDPSVLVLDEPSTGVDPFSRRLLWDVILEASVKSRKSTVMLTTHSMDECEALCSKAGIMVDGDLRCFGSIPHLKSRFGDGFMLECKLDLPPRHAYSDLEQLVCEHLQTLTSQGDGIQISASQIVGVCSALGNATYADRAIASFSTQLNRGNCAVDVASFCNGWLLEDSVQRLDKFLHTQFNGVALIERQADFCRYKVTAPRHDASNDSTQAQEQIATALSRMFEIVEAAKGRLDIKEYSLSQTTLEQIFNSFAGRRSAVEPGNLGNNSILQ
ncbi:ATP-binding cassette sub-family A member 3 [Phytophthora cactorum]|nr:ATP-binding cassette sub-family A member 3 [Phytophthora cactorum]